MLCYDHMSAGTEREAVASCPICGRGICNEHANEHTMQIYRESGWTGHDTTYILCNTCLKAVTHSS